MNRVKIAKMLKELFAIVQEKFAIPASETPCERCFTTTGYLCSAKKNRVNDKYLMQLSFINFN